MWPQSREVINQLIDEEEDVLHMIFKCKGAVDIWKVLGIEAIIVDACQANRSGPDVLKELLISTSVSVPGYSSIMLQETVTIAAWYIWWLRRRHTHGENTPRVFRCAMSIHTIAANSAKSTKLSNIPVKEVWERPRASISNWTLMQL
jgi:hypothetical protein